MRKAGRTGREELFMNAKDKEKKKLISCLLGNAGCETITVDPEEYRERADILNKTFYENGKEGADKPEVPIPETGPSECEDLSDEEQMSCDIAMQLAFMTEERFEDLVDDLTFRTVKKLVRRIGNSDPKSAVKMLQSMFLTYDMADMADALDILNICADYDEDAYSVFVQVLFDTDVFDWFSVECMLDDYDEGESDDTRPWKR